MTPRDSNPQSQQVSDRRPTPYSGMGIVKFFPCVSRVWMMILVILLVMVFVVLMWS